MGFPGSTDRSRAVPGVLFPRFRCLVSTILTLRNRVAAGPRELTHGDSPGSVRVLPLGAAGAGPWASDEEGPYGPVPAPPGRGWTLRLLCRAVHVHPRSFIRSFTQRHFLGARCCALGRQRRGDSAARGDPPSREEADAPSPRPGTRGGPRRARMCGAQEASPRSESLSAKGTVLARWPSGGRGPQRTHTNSQPGLRWPLSPPMTTASSCPAHRRRRGRRCSRDSAGGGCRGTPTPRGATVHGPPEGHFALENGQQLWCLPKPCCICRSHRTCVCV